MSSRRPADHPKQSARQAGASKPRRGRSSKHDFSTWIVTDNWPENVPVSDVEISIFEAWFGDVFDEIFEQKSAPQEVPKARKRAHSRTVRQAKRNSGKSSPKS